MEANQSDSPRNIASRIPEARKAGLRERERRGQHSLERPGGGRIWPLDWCSGARDQRGKPASMAAHEPGGQSLSWNQGGERIREGRGDWFGLSAGGEYERGDRDRALGRELLRSTSNPTRSCGREPRSPPESNAVRLLPRPKFCRSSRSPIPRRRSTGASKKEKVQETAGQGDGTEVKMDTCTDSPRPILPPPDQNSHESEAQGLLQLRVNNKELIHLRGSKLRSPGAPGGEKAAGVSSPLLLQGGEQSPGPGCRGRGINLCGDAKILSPDLAATRWQSTTSSRNGNFVMGNGLASSRKDFAASRFVSTATEGIGVDSARDNWGFGCSARTSSQGEPRALLSGGGQDSKVRVFPRNQVGKSIERKRKEAFCAPSSPRERRQRNGKELGQERDKRQERRPATEQDGGSRALVGKACDMHRALSPPPGNWDPPGSNKEGSNSQKGTHGFQRSESKSFRRHGASLQRGSLCREAHSERGFGSLVAKDLFGLGPHMLRLLPSVQGSVGKAMQDTSTEDIFPLPSPLGIQPFGCEVLETWAEGVVRSLNWLSCRSFCLGKGPPSKNQGLLLREVLGNLKHLQSWKGVDLSNFHPQDMFNQKLVNAYGVEIHVAHSVRWENISHSLPKEGVAGILPARDVCIGGFNDFINNPEQWLKPPRFRSWVKPPKVMVSDGEWPRVVEGLLGRGLCGIMPLSDVLHVDGAPILGGMFGVPKNETTAEGIEILRLIMDFRPCNENFLHLGGDLSTLPVLSQMFQLEIRPHESIVISSEDIRAMFYIIGLPDCWRHYFAFSKPVPQQFCPPNTSGTYVLYSRVLPMGFLNSVAVAQHLHRQVVAQALKGSISSSWEIRRDQEFPRAPQYFRTYLDNFDELCIHSKQILSTEHLSLVELLQSKYSELGIPRNEKKAVSNAECAEIQGAIINGEQGTCSAKPDKISKYLSSLVFVLQRKEVSRKQMQMLVGGLVYLFSFRRPLMSVLNKVWVFISSFSNDKQYLPLPPKVAQELFAAFFLCPLSFMDFRQPSNPVVTASDASESGGGLCASVGLTQAGLHASRGLVRGETHESFQDGGILVISAFDGIASLRVALDALHANVSGYVSIEKDPAARRVVETHFPSTIFEEDICLITPDRVREWAALFPNCKCVLLGGGPPSQGRSFWNAGCSNMCQKFCELRCWVTETFSWCPTFSLLEGVSSMSLEDRQEYSKVFGILPYEVDSKQISLCRRPRLWWFNWEITKKEGYLIYPPETSHSSDYGAIVLEAPILPSTFIKPGWKLTNPEGAFATFLYCPAQQNASV